ncbi:MAG TPA: isoaspartyl peptidase/L-asparaginase [Albitalea sp.]|nr:isoaspartyl peptidase/L-asparaginase [Albitalea sp.]
MSLPFAFALHGGAGTIAPTHPQAEAPYHEALRAATARALAVLAADGSSLDAVVEAVAALEDCPLFNAGHGAVFCADGGHELDAGVMDGRTLAAGGVAGVRTVRNPVRAALELMYEGRCVLMGADAAERLAAERGLDIVEPGYFSTAHRLAQLREVQARRGGLAALDHDREPEDADSPHRFGTVGAVARDRHGHLAAATSTGGMTNKPPGRIGDSPIVGAGVYANDATCAVSCTGTGEHFIRACLGHDVHARMRYGQQGTFLAAHEALAQTLGPLGGRGGMVVVGRDGQIAMPFNSRGMYRAWVREGDDVRTAIFA